jgi:hypothetical protein
VSLVELAQIVFHVTKDAAAKIMLVDSHPSIVAMDARAIAMQLQSVASMLLQRTLTARSMFVAGNLDLSLVY